MNRLEYRFSCLDGNYFFVCEMSDTAVFKIETDIPELENKEGQLDDEKKEAFIKELKEAGIERWESNYHGDSAIEDAVKWYVKYNEDDREYVSDGEESFEPYNYEHLIRALMICDEKAEYFLI